MPRLLSEEQVACYHRDGFFCPVTVMGAKAAARYRASFEAYERAHGGWYEYSKGQKLYLLQTWVSELVSNDRIMKLRQGILYRNVKGLPAHVDLDRPDAS